MIKACALLLLAFHCNAAEIEGLSAIGVGGVPMAKQEAIQDALMQASLWNGAKVEASSHVENGRVSELQRVFPVQTLDRYKLLREWREGSFYHVLIETDPPAEPVAVEKMAASAPAAVLAGTADPQGVLAKQAPARECPQSDFAYRKKLLLAHFQLQNPVDANDLSHFQDGLQQELSRLLSASDHYLPQRTVNETAFNLQPGFYDPVLQPERVRELARRYGTQFVVGGVIRDIGAYGEQLGFAWGSDVRSGERRISPSIPMLKLNGWLPNIAELGLKIKPSSRRFEADVYVFDGSSGALLKQQRFADSATGDVVQGRDYVFGSRRFYETDFGKMVEQQLGQIVAGVDDALACQAFAARISRVDKNRIFIDAGSTARLTKGDKLQLFRVSGPNQVIAAVNGDSSMSLGTPEELISAVTITQVQPLFAIAIIENGSIRPEVGDYVRFSMKESR
ncbi:MAG: flagella assembly protein FlgT [Burkholderiales bacterium]|nr:flagella assembly protein FlgT [Burkholderiales bacterium]